MFLASVMRPLQALILIGFVGVAYAASDSTGLSETGLPLVDGYQSLAPVDEPIRSVSSLEAWLESRREQFGIAEDAALGVVEIDSGHADYSLFRIKQSQNDIEIFGHESVVVLNEGQPFKAYLVTSDLPAKPFDRGADHVKIGLDFLRRENLEVEGEPTITQVYWRLEDRLEPALQIDGHLTRNGEEYPYQLIVSTAGEVLEKFPLHLDFAYQVVDVDEACREARYSGVLTHNDLLELFQTVFVVHFPPAESSADARTTNARRLATLFEDVGEFAAVELEQEGLNSVDSVDLIAFVGDRYDQPSRNAGGSLGCGPGRSTNAFWFTLDGSRGSMQIHTPLLDNPEVIMHELAHGYVSYSSNLIYQGQPGALNEAYSDALGVAFAAWRSGRLDSPTAADWKIRIGREVVRDFQRPTSVTALPPWLRQMPDHYDVRYTGTEDYGGVHFNSSIINHAFFLLAEGGAHRRLAGDAVPAIGMRKALKIWHYGTTRILTRVSDFRNARYAFADAAEILFGKYSSERTAVHKAFDAIGVKGRWKENVRPPEPDPEPEPEPEPTPAPPEEKADPPTEESVPEPAEPGGVNGVALAMLGLVVLLGGALFAVLRRSRPGAAARPSYDAYSVPRPQQSQPAFSRAVAARERFGVMTVGGQAFDVHKEDLEGKGVTIGRSADNDIATQHPSVSARHARIFLKGGALLLEDLGSSFGTQVNGDRVQPGRPVEISAGSHIVISDLSCRWTPTNTGQRGGFGGNQPGPASRSVLMLKGHSGNRRIDVLIEGASEHRIGRQADNNVVIDHPSVSSRHGVITLTDERWYFSDSGSSYGSAHKSRGQQRKLSVGERVQLADGDTLYLADLPLNVEIK